MPAGSFLWWSPPRKERHGEFGGLGGLVWRDNSEKLQRPSVFAWDVKKTGKSGEMGKRKVDGLSDRCRLLWNESVFIRDPCLSAGHGVRIAVARLTVNPLSRSPMTLRLRS